MPSALILCTGNSCRSQMAEGFLKRIATGWEVFSAGTEPADRVHPMAVKVMDESGIDISNYRPKSTDQFVSRDFDYVITVCDNARETCPVFIGNVANRLHMGFEDPAFAKGTNEEVLDVFRSVRNKIENQFTAFYQSING